MKAIRLAVVAFVSAASCASLAPGVANTPNGRASPSADAVSAAPTGSAAAASGSFAAPSGPSAAPSTTASLTPAERAAQAPALTAQRSGADLVITLSGLTPGERGELTVKWSTRAPVGPITADATGEVHLQIPLGDDAPTEVIVRRASGQELRAAVGPQQAASSAVPAGTATPPSVIVSTSAPSSQAPTSRAGTRLAVAIDPADPPPGTAPDIVVGGLLAGEEFRLEITVLGVVHTYPVQADPIGLFSWRSPVTPGIAFQVAAVRVTGERASTAFAVAPPPTTAPVPTYTAEPTCATSGGDPARTGRAGMLGYGGAVVEVPVEGVIVEARDGGVSGRLLGTAISGADGTFRILGIPAGTQVVIWSPAQGLYPATSPSYPDQQCANQIMRRFNVIVVRYITGFNYANGATIPDRAAIRWDPVPGVTSYCVELRVPGSLRPPSGITPTGTCPGLNPGYPVGTATSFTLPSMRSGDRFQVTVYGYTTKVFLPIALLRGGQDGSAFYDLTVQ